MLFKTPNILLDDLEAIVKKCLPDGLHVEIEALKRLAIISYNVEGNKVHFFPVEKLSESPQERMTQMFKFQQVWNEKELFAYLEEFDKPEKIVSKFTVKFSDPQKGKKTILYKLKAGILV